MGKRGNKCIYTTPPRSRPRPSKGPGIDRQPTTGNVYAPVSDLGRAPGALVLLPAPALGPRGGRGELVARI
eukprot:5952855-Pyramimonas_sp.AAC.1